MNNHLISIISILVAVTALAFLVYSLRHRKALGIGRSHPRILVEGFCCILLLTIGILAWSRY